MIDISKTYKEHLNELTKNKLMEVVNEYHTLCDIYGLDKEKNVDKKKKQDIINYILEHVEDYIKCFVMSLDLSDFSLLKDLVLKSKKVTDAFFVDNREFINILLDKRIIFQKENLEIASDIMPILKKYINDKTVNVAVKKNDELYKIASGMIIAYGVLDIDLFSKNVSSLEKVNYYYKKDYVIDDKKVVSTKLTNKKKINSYLKNVNYKEFTTKDFLNLGASVYHHNIKSYKKFIKMLKNNYVFKNSDIMYIDREVVIPYLYNSLNEEEIANKNLEETIVKLFEFKGDKLRNKMLKEITAIREDFPIWEYRGYTKNEVK